MTAKRRDHQPPARHPGAQRRQRDGGKPVGQREGGAELPDLRDGDAEVVGHLVQQAGIDEGLGGGGEGGSGQTGTRPMPREKDDAEMAARSANAMMPRWHRAVVRCKACAEIDEAPRHAHIQTRFLEGEPP
jgi:hypothetical protein